MEFFWTLSGCLSSMDSISRGGGYRGGDQREYGVGVRQGLGGVDRGSTRPARRPRGYDGLGAVDKERRRRAGL